jgi:RNA polymerase sigma-70 factor (ECF subfamily)
MKLIKSQPHFNDTEHEKAWLIRTATNVCKNYLKHWSRKNVNLDECEDMVSVCDNLRGDTEDSDILSAVRELPETLKTAVYLYFYEGYNSVEIAEMLNKPDSTIRSYLKKAKVILKQKLQVSQETQDTQRYKEVTS